MVNPDIKGIVGLEFYLRTMPSGQPISSCGWEFWHYCLHAGPVRGL